MGGKIGERGGFYPLRRLIKRIAIDPFTLKYATNIDKPTADSAAATTNTKNANNCPHKESNEIDAHMKIKFIANNISSMDIRSVSIFFLFTTIPNIPIKNKRKKNNIDSVGNVAKR
jgi:hypothetical protein